MRSQLAALASLFLISCTTQPVVPDVVIDTPPTVENTVSQNIDALLATNILKIGKNDAPLSLLQFTNYECAFCKEFHKQHLPNVLQPFIDNNQLQLQIAIQPLQKYPNSSKTAAALHCAKQQAKGVEMHNYFMENEWSNDTAATLELDEKAYALCVNSEETTALLAAQQKVAEELDITVVPTFFLNGEKFVGLPYESELQGRLEYALTKLNES